eukprot:jgi/Picre1/31129/NNA_006483.t1
MISCFRCSSKRDVQRKTALQNNAMLAGIDDVLELTHERYGEDDIISDDEDMLRSFWSDDDDWEEAEYKKGESIEREETSSTETVVQSTAQGGDGV